MFLDLRQKIVKIRMFPQLRPEHEQAPIRETFNRAWLREQCEARLADLERQRAEQRIERPDHSMHRDWGGRKAAPERTTALEDSGN